MKRETIYIGPDFLLLMLIVCLWLDTEVGISIFMAWLLHEGGHILFLYLLGGRVRSLSLTLLGAKIVTEQNSMGYGRELLCVLAGPGVNLGLSLGEACLGEEWYLFSGVNLALGVFNLLPLPGLDGGRVIKLLILLLTKREEK